MVDVLKHDKVPEHSLVNQDELQQVLEEYDIDKTDLPKIKYDTSTSGFKDPALKAMDEDVEPGDVVKVVRESRTADTAVVYRLVVE